MAVLGIIVVILIGLFLVVSGIIASIFERGMGGGRGIEGIVVAALGVFLLYWVFTTHIQISVKTKQHETRIHTNS